MHNFLFHGNGGGESHGGGAFTQPILPTNLVFAVSGRQLLTLYLYNNAFRGELPNAIIPGGCFVAAGLNIFSVRPDELPFVPSHRTQQMIWGYFSAVKPTFDIQHAVGGYWVRYGEQKRYVGQSGNVFGLRRRFVFQVKQQGADRRVTWVDTQWQMKEYGIDKDADSTRLLLPDRPKANLDFVIRKVFTKLVVMAPPPPPIPSSKALQKGRSRLPARSPRSRKVRESTTKPVDPPPLPARSNLEAGPMDPLPPPPSVYSSETGNPGSNDDGHGKERVDCVVKPKGCYVIENFFNPKVRAGKFKKGTIIPGYITEGVNIFSVKPDELPFQPSQKGERWGYFFCIQPASDELAASGGRWVRYGPEKWYQQGVVLRRRFVFHAESRDGDGQVRRDPTRWLMKEYRMNREHQTSRFIQRRLSRANLDCVMYKVFRKPVDPAPPPPPPAQSREERPGSDNNSVVNDEAGPSSTNNPIFVDDEAGPTSLHHAKHDRSKASNNLVVPPPPPVHSSEKENPRVDEDRVKKYKLNKDDAVFTLEPSVGPPGSNSNNPVMVDDDDDDAEPTALHRATPDHSEASKNLVGFSAFTKPVVHPPSSVRSSRKDNPSFTFPVVEEDQMKEHRLTKDGDIFPCVQPNPKLVADMKCVVHPSLPVRSSGKENSGFTFPVVEEDQMKELCLSKDGAIFPCVQPNPELVVDMECVVHPSSPVRSSGKENPDFTFPVVEEDQMKEHCLTKDGTIFPCVQPHHKLVADMECVVRPSSPVRSSGKENSGFTFPVVEENQMKEHCLTKDDAIFPCVQPNPKLVADMECVVRPPSPLDLELRLGPSPDVRSDWWRPNSNLVANMDRVIRPSPPPLNLEKRLEQPPLDLELRLGPPGSYHNDLSLGKDRPGEVERSIESRD